MNDAEFDRMEQKLKAVRLQTSKALDERVLGAARETAAPGEEDIPMTQELAIESAGRARAPKWRLKSRAFKVALTVATAACVLAGMFWWLTTVPVSGPGPVPVPRMAAYASLVEAMENSKAAEWVHMRSEMNGQEAEAWISFQPYRNFSITPDSIAVEDHVEERRYSYDRNTNTITIDALPRGSEDPMDDATNFFDAMMAGMKMMQETYGVEVTQSRELLDDWTYDVITVSLKGMSSRTIINPETQRIIRSEGVTTDEAGQQKNRVVIYFDYPESGPADIYELGVPRDATIIKTFQEELRALEKMVVSARKRFDPTYFAIVYNGMVGPDGVYSPSRIRIVYKKNGRYRIERYPVRPPGESLSREDLRRRLPADDMAALEAELKTRKPSDVLLAEPARFERTRIYLDDKGNLQKETQRFSGWLDTAEPASWPFAIPAKGSVAEPEHLKGKVGRFGPLTAAENLSMGLTAGGKSTIPPTRTRWYFNPERDYICEEYESLVDVEAPWQDDPDWLKGLDLDEPGRTRRSESTRKVIEYAKTPAGRWYAKKVLSNFIDHQDEHSQSITIVHLDTTREIPLSLFDPDRVSSDTFPPKELTFAWHFNRAIKEIDSHAEWPDTPEALVKAYWKARAAKDYDEMAVLWPGSGVWNKSVVAREKPVEYVFGKAEDTGHGSGVIVPYASSRHYEETGAYNLKMRLTNEKSAKGRHYITSGN